MDSFELLQQRSDFAAPTFTLQNRVRRVLWRIVWMLLARWTPPMLHRWRILLLNAFGAQVSFRASVYASVDVWAPWNLSMQDYATLAPGVTCYNIARISLGHKAIVSQDAFLCTGTHNYHDPAFPLVAKAIEIRARAWVCARAVVGPGVTVGEGAVLSAAGVTFKDLNAWEVYVGNPASSRQQRNPIRD